MPAKTPARKAAPAAEGPDPRFVPVVKALARTAGFSLMESKSGAMRGMTLNGTSFGMSSHGRFIVKLTEERAAALVARGIGKPFSPSAGRVLKGWLEVTHPTADWVALAKEACRLASTASTGKRRVTGSAKAPSRFAGAKKASTAGSADPDKQQAALLKAFAADTALAPVVEAFEAAQRASGGRRFGKNGLKARDGKLFALFTQGTLVVKLAPERVASLVGRGVGTPFDPGHGRLMKGWLTITSAKASWSALAKEAYAFVRGGG